MQLHGNITLAKHLMRAIPLVLFVFSFSISLSQTTYYSRVTGNWSLPSTWSTAGCGGVKAVSIPGANDNVVICSGHIVTLDSDYAVNDITINASATLNHQPNDHLSLNGNYTNNGTETGGNNASQLRLTGSSKVINGSGDIGPGGGVVVSGTYTIISSANLSISNGLTVNGATTLTNDGTVDIVASEIYGTVAGSTWKQGATGILHSKGKVLVTGTLDASASGNSVIYDKGAGQPIKGATYHHLTIIHPTVSCTKWLAGSITVNGDFTLSGAVTLDVTSANYTITCKGDWINTSSRIPPIYEKNGTDIFNGPGNQQMANTLATTFYNITIDKPSGILSLSNNITISNLLTMTSGTFDTDIYTVDGTGGFTATGGDFQSERIGVTLPELTGIYTVSGGSITLNGSGAQTIGDHPYNNLTLGGSGTKSLTVNTTVNGNLTIDANCILSNGPNQLRVNGNYTCNGTNTASAQIRIQGSTGTEVIDGTGAVIISGANNFVIRTSSKTIASSANLTISAKAFRYGGAGTWTVTNNGTITLALTNRITTANAGTWVNSTNSTLNYDGGDIDVDLDASASGNLVNYNKPGNQSLKTPISSYWNLTLSKTGTKTALNNLDINGNITISGSAQLDLDQRDMKLAGNWLNTSSHSDPFLENATIVTLDGPSSQTIENISDERFYDLIIDKGGGQALLAANTNIVVSNALTLTRGIVKTNSFTDNLVILPNNATSTPGNNLSYVDGKVRKIGNDAFVFPTGDNTVWARIGISAPASVSDIFTAQYFKEGYGSYDVASPLLNVSKQEYWTLRRDFGSSDVSVELFWENASISLINDCVDLTAASWNASTTLWNENSATATGICTGSGSGSILTDTPVSSFSSFTFSSKNATLNPLPINLLSFGAALIEDVTEVKWTTLTESNNDYFTVERSEDGQDFEFLTAVPGAGTSNSIKGYTIIDENPLRGTSYYRLKQTDYDGTAEIFPMVAVNYQPKSDLSVRVYPNPSAGQFWINIEGSKGDEVSVVVLDMMGREYVSKAIVLEENAVKMAIDPHNKLIAGMYMVVCAGNNKLYSTRLLIQ